MDNYKKGHVPFISSGANMNGSADFYSPQKNEILDEKNCITISPVDGSAFYQPIDFLGRGGGGSSIIILRSEKLNCYNGVFLARAINNTTKKYQYGHMANSDGIKKDKILLPIDDNQLPDYKYMEKYIKNVMIRKYNNILNHLK